MGIRGLHTCLVNTIPEIIQDFDWQTWKNKRIGIDIQCFLYRSIAEQLNPLTIIASQIAAFKKLEIQPIYIFDGKPPSEKESIINKRKSDRIDALEQCERLKHEMENEDDEIIRESIRIKINEIESKFPNLTYKMKTEIKQFLYATGTMFICPSCEADTLLAYWYRRKVIDGIVSFDLDFIARDCELIVPKSVSSEVGSGKREWKYYNPALIRKKLHLCEDKFLSLCVLMGSDYTPSLTIVPWKRALHSLQKNKSLEEIWQTFTSMNWRKANNCEKIRFEIEMFQKAKVILNGSEDSSSCLMESVQWTKWNEGFQKPEIATLKSFRETYGNTWNCDWWDLFTQQN